MSILSTQLLRLLHVILLAASTMATMSTKSKDSECYTANGRDYEGTQATTYVKSDAAYEKTDPNVEVCLQWKDIELDFNVTDRDKTLPKNYCRNPNNLLFPYCYVDRNGAQTRAFCHIPTCSTPALMGCFKLFVNGNAAPKGSNVTTTGPPPDLILDGEKSLDGETDMRVGRCLDFCRKEKYDYAGVTGGDTCMCGKKEEDGPQMQNTSNILHPHDCIQSPCSGDKLQACGGDNAIAIYDVEAGSCNPVPHYDQDSGILYSPRWPGKYHDDATCQWTVYVPARFLKNETARKDYKLHVYFSYLHLEKKNDTLKLYKYLNDTSAGAELISTLSGKNKEDPPEYVLEVSQIIAFHMVFRTDKDHKHEGFILHYKITNLLGDMVTSLPDKAVAGPGAEGGKKSTNVRRPSNPNATPGKVGRVASASLTGGQVAGIVLGVLLFIILAVFAALVLMRYKGKLFKEEVTASNPPAMFDNPVNFNSDDTTL